MTEPEASRPLTKPFDFDKAFEQMGTHHGRQYLKKMGKFRHRMAAHVHFKIDDVEQFFQNRILRGKYLHQHKGVNKRQHAFPARPAP